ncbi:MAG: AMP-binding protein, partial [Halanaerobiales bacterium]|nr:AMP-binding protein [Halanaerobiales bacterium]
MGNILELRTLTDMFTQEERLAELTGKGIRFIHSTSKEDYLTYEELYDNSLNLLYHLQLKGIKPGQELVFQIDDNQDFIQCFWACLLGGIIPIPISIGNNDEHKRKLVQIWKVLNNQYLITSDIVGKKVESYTSLVEDEVIIEDILSKTIYLNELSSDGEGVLTQKGIIHQANPDDIAFIQFSSGSTGDPKGVVLTHRNLIININAISIGYGVSAEDVYMSWMPLTHDLGLIGWHLVPLCKTCLQNIMATSLFIRNPRLWIEKSYEHKCTMLASPNFGYKHFLKFYKYENFQDLDLSHIRFILNGAEPISLELCREFIGTLVQHGLRKNVMVAAYGMAEASLCVSVSPLDEELTYYCLDRRYLSIGERIREIDENNKKSVIFVDTGYEIPDVYVRICDDNNNPLADGTIGYIQIKGDNVTKGYYNNPKATNKVQMGDGWLNTGDIGFVVDKRLTITGRAKDIIFVNGQNYYPHDIERISEAVEGIELNKIAVCGVFDEKEKYEKIIVFVLYKKKISNFIPLVKDLKRHINITTGLEINQVIPVRKISKTTSGKLQRYKLVEKYLNGIYDEKIREINQLLAEEVRNKMIVEPTTEIEKKLVQIWEETLGLEKIGVTDDFFELGVNSIKASLLSLRIHRELAVELNLREFMVNSNIRKLADYISKMDKTNYTPISVIEEQEYYPISSAQKRIFAVKQIEGEQTSYNLPHFWVIDGELEIKCLTNALQEIVNRHDSFRTSFEVIDGELIQRVHKDIDFQVSFFEVQETELAKIVKEFVRPFNLGKPPLIRAGLVRFADQHLLMIDMHHIISDGASLGIFMEELVSFYTGKELPYLKIQYKDFTNWQNTLFNTEMFKKQEEYWLSRFTDEIPVLNLPADYPRPAEKSFKGDSLKFELSSDLTTKLKQLTHEQDATLYMTLLSVLNIFLAKYTGQEDIIIGTGIANRQHIDLENLIGMFVNTLALRNMPEGRINFVEFLAEVKENALNAYDNQDYPFEMLVEHLGISTNLDRNPLIDVVFVLQNTDIEEQNVGNLKFKPYEYNNKTAQFDITLHAFEVKDQIHFKLEYSTDIFKKETIERFAKHFVNIIRKVIENPKLRISEIEMITKSEMQQLLFDFNNTKTEYPKDKTIQQLFEEQVEKT